MSVRDILKAFWVWSLTIGTIMGMGMTTTVFTPALAQQKKAVPSMVGVDAVIQEQARQTVPILGRLVTQNTGVVSVLVKGVVTQIDVHVGDRVQRGDVLATLDPNSLKWGRELRRAEIKSAQANLANAKAQSKLNRQILKRLENLRKSSAFSPARFEDAVQELSKAESNTAKNEADLIRARANLELANIDLDYAQVKAPYDGVVTTVNTAVGTYLNTGQPVVSLVDDRHMEIEADIPAQRISGLKPGTVVSFTRGGVEAQATVRALVPSENPLTRTRTVRFTPNADSLGANVALNQSVSLLIPAGPARAVVTVHKDAVLNRGGGQIVYVITDGKAQVRPVKLGAAVGGRFIVISGLTPGDLVVVRGNERLRPGQDVRATDAP